MTLPLPALSFAALLMVASTAPGFAQDAMATDAMAGDAMAGDAMAGDMVMSDEDLALCLEQVAMITFPSVLQAASDACHVAHNGMMGSAMGGDAMATDAMATAAMAPKQ